MGATPRSTNRRIPRHLFSASALSAAAAAMALAACGPRDEATLAGGSAPVIAPATVTMPAAPPLAAVAPAPNALQGQPVPQAPVQVAAAAPAAAYAPPPPQAYAPPPANATYPSDPVQAQPAPTRQVAQRVQATPSNRIGSIESIEPIRNRPQGSGAGAVVGGVLGAVVGNQFGHGLGRAAMTGVGVAGGAIAGNNLERNYREGVVGYRVNIRLDNGHTRTFERSSVGNLHVGDRVRLDASSFHRA